MKFLLSSLLLFVLFSGCGYKPASYYAKNAIEGAVYVDLKVDIDNSENSVFVKDAMNEMILNQFKVNLVEDKAKADTYVTVALSSVSHSSISTDSDGYVQSYRTTVNIKMTYQKIDEKMKTINVNDYYDYTVDSDSTITDQKKKLAIKSASTKALNNVFSKIAVNSMKD
ncbi:LPS assembly lipoprotein LptE [Arcobacteraceae bacterium]|jgi:hypothetical protein|nr:LPS assembly lipoprotein LptE [Arcobacteraceae bacterium]